MDIDGESKYSYHYKYWNDITISIDNKSDGISNLYNELGLL